MSENVAIEKEMGITHAEFFRNITRLLGEADFQRTENSVTLEESDKSLIITLSEQSQRRIALFVLPVTHVTLTFSGYDEAGIGAMMNAFDNVFRRGGG